MTKPAFLPSCFILICICVIGSAELVPSETSPASTLVAKVTIRRDLYGIPHILAETEEAAGFGFGYAQAEDHCLVIARSLVSARGEEARYFGTGIESDFLLVLYDITQEAAQDLRNVSSVYRKIVNAYAEGVNRYVREHRSELPDWIPAFTGIDVMASRRAGAIRSAFSQATIRALQRKYPATGNRTGDKWLAIAASEDAGIDTADEPPGSNAFALSGARTTSGFPILLGNRHLNWSSLIGKPR